MKNMRVLKSDPILKDYWRNNERFTDLFSQIFFEGKDSIDPSRLSEVDPKYRIPGPPKTRFQNLIWEGWGLLYIK